MKAATPDGLGAHAVILLAVSEKPFQQAVEYARPRGTIVAIGMPANAFLKAPVFETVVKMIAIKGSYVGNRQDAAEAVDFYARGLIKAPFKTVPLEELPKVFELMGKLSTPSLLPCKPLICLSQSKGRLPAAMSSRCRSRCINRHEVRKHHQRTRLSDKHLSRIDTLPRAGVMWTHSSFAFGLAISISNEKRNTFNHYCQSTIPFQTYRGAPQDYECTRIYRSIPKTYSSDYQLFSESPATASASSCLPSSSGETVVCGPLNDFLA